MAKGKGEPSRKNVIETGKIGRGKPPVEHQFKPGNPGRPKGSRNKLGEAFITALHDDFQVHGVGAIVEVRESRPHEYLKVVASLLPKEIKVSATEDLSDEQLDQRIRQLAAALSLELRSEEGIDGVAGGTEAPPRPH